MILFINTTEFNKLQFALINQGDLKLFEQDLAFNENYKTLELLEKFLKQSKVLFSDLSQIIVCSGPGSFTGIRVGLSLAQAFGFAKNIPVHTITKNKIPADLIKLESLKLGATKVFYGTKPNITMAKKKTR
jgi:tRNA threonylcarbamoyladenosine biosynthesis protein TsaB